MGFQCPDCVANAAKAQRQGRTVAGGTVPRNPGAVSTAIIVVNVGVFLLTMATGGNSSPIFRQGAMLSSTVMDLDGTILTGFVDGAWWRPLTSAFLHSGIAHLVMNMVAVYIFGTFLERALGVARYLTAYVLALLGASLAVLLLAPSNVLTVGASGAVYGLFALALVLLIRLKQDVRFLLALLAINLVISFTGGISWQAHAGGFVVGLLLAVAFAYAPRERRTLVHAATIAVLIGAIAVGYGVGITQV